MPNTTARQPRPIVPSVLQLSIPGLVPAPGAKLALPTSEDYAPVLVAAGAEADERPRTSFPITGWWMGSAFTKRSV